jgi:hypothetical protein
VKSLIRYYFTLVLLMFLTACAPASVDKLLADGKKPLTEKQLYELVTSHSLHLEAIDFDAKVQYFPDGHLSAKSIEGESDKGKWNINSSNQLCMKFNRWYYSDLKCYELFYEDNKYLFFTSNGARYYTGTASADNIDDHMSQVAAPENIVSRQNDSLPAPLSMAEKEHTLVSLARNCPDCNFAGVDLKDAQLIAANLAGANLSGADLRDANLRRANLVGANLSGANLTRTNLAGADLTDCDLSGADLSGSNLILATVTGAKLDGAILVGAHLDNIKGLNK